MVPQAKPLCSRDRYQNSEYNPGLHSLKSLTTTPSPWVKVQAQFPRQNVNLNFHGMSLSLLVDVILRLRLCRRPQLQPMGSWADALMD